MVETQNKQLTTYNVPTKSIPFEQLSTEDRSIVNRVIDRQVKMDSGRKQYEKKWRTFDLQFDATTGPRRDGRANPMIPFEQMLIDVYTGSLEEGLPVKVTARGGKVDATELELGKYILQEFQERENSQEEICRFDNLKGRYGTGILRSGLWIENKYVANDNKGYFDNKATMGRKEIYHIGVQAGDIYRTWFDESAKKWRDCMDCIEEEVIRMEEFRMRYLETDEKAKEGFKYIFNVHTDNSKQYDSTSDNRIYYNEVRLWHYYNIIDGTYVIVANKQYPIFIGKMTTKHGYLPLIPVQHYTNPESIYGIGIPERYATCKPMINNFLKIALDSAWINSGNLIFTGNDVELDDEIYIEPGENTIVRFSGDIKQVQQFQSNINIGQIRDILLMMEDYGIQSTGLNLKASYNSPAGTAFEAGMMKEEQNQRARPVARNRNIGLDTAFTMMLCNILQFAPTLYANVLFNDKQIKDFQWYKIKIPGKTIIREDDKIASIQDTPGYDDYFDLTTDTLLYGNGLKVQIETPSTPNTLKFIERDDLNKFIQTKLNVFAVTQDPQILQGINAVMKKMDMLYNIDPDNVMMKGQEDIEREKNAQMIATVASFNTGQPTEDAQTPTQPTQTPVETGAGGQNPVGGFPPVPTAPNPLG